MKRVIVAVAMALVGAPAQSSDLVFTGNYIGNEEYSGNFAWGGGIFVVEEKGISFYGNLFMSGHSDSDHYDSLDLESYGDPVNERKKDVTAFNFGGTFGFSENIATYMGLGFVSERGYAKKYDPTHILGEDGTYYVDDPAGDDSGVNFNPGLLVFLKRFTLEVGYHTFLQQGYVGAGWRF